MNWKELAKKVAPYLPTISDPKRELTFTDRLKYTLIVLVCYFVLSSLFLIGLSSISLKKFELMSTILAANMGTLLSLGIGPIISGMIVFELLVSSKVITLDIRTPEDRFYYTVLQKLFAIFFILYENAVLIFGGMLIPENFAPFPLPHLFLLTQLFIGGFLLMLLDEVVQKYGIGSGISLFIVASVSSEIITKAFSPFTLPGESIPSGRFLAFVYGLLTGNIKLMISSLIPIITTLLIFLIATYFLLVRVELPIYVRTAFGNVVRYPLPLFYTSNIPVIFAAAFLAIFQFFAFFMEKSNFPLISNLGSFILGIIAHPTIIDFINNPSLALDVTSWIKVFFYFLYFIVFSTLFSIMWIEVSEQNPESVAEFLGNVAFIPGTRSSKRYVKDLLRRYIYPVALLGGALVGFLAALADFLGALSRGTGILLAIMILYNLYDRVLRYHLSDLKNIAKLFGINIP